MRRIDRTAAKYSAMGHAVRVLSGTRCQVTDRLSGTVYRVTAGGRAVVGRELAAEIAADSEVPHCSTPPPGGVAEGEDVINFYID